MKQTIGFECRLAIPSSFWRIANSTLMDDIGRMAFLLGVTNEEAERISLDYQKSKSIGDACLVDVMRDTDSGKFALIESGELDPSKYFCKDTLEMAEGLCSRGYALDVFTKGGSQCVYSALKHTPFSHLIENGQIRVTSVSSDRFHYHDRRTPDCYREWAKQMKSQDKSLIAYLSDREDEAIACLSAGVPTAIVDRTQREVNPIKLNNGLWLINDLSQVENWLSSMLGEKNE